MITRKKATKPKYQGKSKADIVREAFQILGVGASRDDITKYMQEKYSVPGECAAPVFYGTRAAFKNGKLEKVRETGSNGPVSLVLRCKELAKDVGGLDSLEELVKALK